MFTADAIEELSTGIGIYQAGNAIKQAFDQNNAVVALPEKFGTHDLENYLPNRRRARGVMQTSSDIAFAQYVEQHKEDGASVFVSQSEMQAVAVLNLGTPDKPGHADNKAVLTLDKTAAYTALLNHANGRGLSQTVAAEFIEDWADAMLCKNDDGYVSAAQAVAAIRKMTIESMRKVESTEQSLSASKSSFEQVSATSKDPIPTTINFDCVPYVGLSARKFVLRLGVLTSGDKPSISLRIIKAEQHEEEMAQELAVITKDALGSTEITVLLGSYRKA